MAAACEHLALGDAAREPSGLARLADAFATLTFSRAVSPSQRFVAAAQRGLAQVSKAQMFRVAAVHKSLVLEEGS